MNLRIYDDLLVACVHQNNIIKKITELSTDDQKTKDVIKEYNSGWVNSVIERANEISESLSHQ